MKRNFDVDAASKAQKSEQRPTPAESQLRAKIHPHAATFPRHTHDYFELEIVADGKGQHNLNGTFYPLSRGSFYFITPADYHEFSVKDGEEMTIWNVSFDENYLDAKMRYEVAEGSFLPAVLSEEELAYIETLFILLTKECERKENSCTVSLLDALLCLLRRTSRLQNEEKTKQGSPEIQRALAYLQEHFLEAPDLKTVAAFIGFHPAYFSALFKKALGIGYTEYLNHLRIAYAKSLLARGGSVSEVCFTCGFGSLSNFQHTFRKNVLMTPSEYKKQRRNASHPL